MARLIIVEDEQDLAQLYRLSLESAGHDVVGVFADPHTALTLEAEGVDLVILDESLGTESGTAYLGRFRERFPGAYLIVATGHPEAIVRAQQAGADEVRKKPFDLPRFLRDLDERFGG